LISSKKKNEWRYRILCIQPIKEVKELDSLFK
jgi:hypothetical protein